MSDVHTFFSWSRYSSIPYRAAVLLTAVVWSSVALCGEIHDAATGGDLAKVKALVEADPHLVSSKDTNGCTPLLLAAANGHKDIVELLVAKKADINAKENFDGCGPLHVAAVKGHKDVVEALLRSKADVDAKNTMGGTPLHMAAMAGKKGVAQLLLASKAKVNAKDKSGDTPLHYAALGGYKDVAELLLASGAEINVKDGKGMTPLGRAKEEENDRWQHSCASTVATNDAYCAPRITYASVTHHFLPKFFAKRVNSCSRPAHNHARPHGDPLTEAASGGPERPHGLLLRATHPARSFPQRNQLSCVSCRMSAETGSWGLCMATFRSLCKRSFVSSPSLVLGRFFRVADE